MRSRNPWLALAAIIATSSIADAAAAQVTVSGIVQTGSSAPVEGALLEFKQGQTVVDSDVSAADGSYSVSLPAGNYSLAVTPPVNSGFVPQTQSGLQFAQSTTLNVVLIPASTPTYSGTVVDRNAAGLPNIQVSLSDGSFNYSDTSDNAGAFSVTASAANQSVRMYCNGCGSSGNEYYNINLPDVDLSSGSVSGATLAFEDRVLTGTITDDQGAPVVNADLSWSQNISYQSGAIYGYGNNYVQTDGVGQFSMLVLPGDGQLSITAPSGSGLGNVVVDVAVPDQVADPSPVNVMLDVAPSYSGTVVDRNAAGLPNIQVSLNDGAFNYSDTSDNAGAFSVTASTANQTARMYCSGCGSSGNEYYNIYLPDVDLSSGSLSGATLTFEDRLLTGTITDDQGAPVVNADLSWSQNISYQSGAISGYGNNYLQTDGAGQFSTLVLPGSGQLSITAPSGSGLGNVVVDVAVPDQVADPSPVNVMLDVAPSYSGTVVDRNAAGLPNIQVSLNDGAFNYSDTSDNAGAFWVTASTANQTARMYCSGCGSSGNEYYNLYLPDVDLSSGSVSGATLAFEDRLLAGAVTDVDDKPITNVDLSWSQNISYQGGAISGYGNNYLQTDANGQFSMLVLPGPGDLQATPPVSSGLAPFNISNLDIVGDQSLAILVQFVSEATSLTVSAGGTITSDPENDGATSDDPIETALTSPVGGMVTIQERPISTVPPTGYEYLTQEIQISAPASTSADPIKIEFYLDSSRVPLGVDQDTLYAFRNGAVLPDCTGPANQASPDPCISARTLLGDGDIMLTALTSAGSIWNLGILEAPVNCGDGILDSGEDCDDGNNTAGDCCSPTCTFEASGASCGDGNLCTTSDTCDGAGACQAGTAVTCTAQSQCHDVGTCNPATSQCSNPPKTSGSACGSSTNDVCTDPDTCDGAGVCQTHDVAGCCTQAIDCDDNDDCTTDTCGSSDTCSSVAIANCCLQDSDCDDSDACTTNSCGSDDRCDHAEIAGCGAEPTDDAGAEPVADAGTDGAIDNPADGAVDVAADAGTHEHDVSADGGESADKDPDCQCNLAYNRRDMPQGLLWFGLIALTRLVRRRRQR